jgi:hypothetical protein
MFKAIAIIAVVLAIAIAIVLILAATKPDTFAVRRAITVKAPPEKLFPLINDFHQWGSWSPYEHKDPAMKRTFSDVGSGKGAVYAWEGNKNVGSGRMEILDAPAPSKSSSSSISSRRSKPQHRRVRNAAAGRATHDMADAWSRAVHVR